MTVTTSRLSLTYPEGPDPVSDLRTEQGNLRAYLDVNAAIYLQGSFASRPAAGTQGRFYAATDTEAVYYDDGDEWYLVSGATKTHRHPFSFTRDELTAWPAGEIGRFTIRLATGETASLETCDYSVASGTSTFKLQRSTGGAFSDLSGFTGMAATTSFQTADPANITLSAGNIIRVYCTAVGTGLGGHVEPVIAYTA